MKRALTAALLGLAFLLGCGPSRQNVVVVGSKNFPEQLILGELIAQQIEATTHLKVERRFYLAGTYICQQAMLAGRIDVYPEYTGTALTAILKELPLKDPAAVYEKVKQQYEQKFQFAVLPSLGFNDTFAIEIRGDDARRLRLATISQAAKYTPQWRAGFGYEFMERPDGYKGLVAAYGLKFAKAPLIMDLGLLGRALADKQIDLAAG
ncbi:MAG TPA: glycine betaine ABC transporter substrate-binding protein, partial [Terriglobales bacterium]